MQHQATASRRELMDSFLHTDIKRVFAGILCGIGAGCVMFLLTTACRPVGTNAVWWFQLLATAVYGGSAMAYEVSPSVLGTGVLIHFFVSGLCGFIMGKLTKNNSFKKQIIYGVVLAGLCWLSSNMFAPNILNVEALSDLGEWTRMFYFVSFGVVMGTFMTIAGRVLDV